MQSRFKLSGADREAAELALQAGVEVAKALGWQPQESSSTDEIQTFQLKVEERAAELCLRISDAARRPSPAAVRQAIRGFIFFEDEYQASIKDGAWFSRNQDRDFRARKPLTHEETQRLSASYHQKAIVFRDQDKCYPVLLLIIHVDFPAAWRSDDEIMQFVDCSDRQLASVH